MKNFGDKVVCPIIIYYDDYANNNPLGSHKGIAKSGAVYIQIPVISTQYQSKIENIFLFILFNTIDRQVFKNEMIFAKAVDELNHLYDQGIEIELLSGRTKIFLELVLFIGDNLGVHTVAGLTESFSADVICQHCLIKQKDKDTIFLEKDCVLRIVENYETLLKLNDSKETGLKERCVLHKITNFHSAKNVAVDVMHDLLEGVCCYDIALILNHFIYNMKLFTLDDINVKLQGFDYGPNYDVNKPPQFNANP